MSFPVIVKPCDYCGFPVEDIDDPAFVDPWLCYHCHCIATGRDIKTSLNDLTTAVKRLRRQLGADR